MYPRTEIKNDIQLIKDMEAEAERKKSKYRQDISLLRSYFEQFKLELIKCESKYDAYNKILEMGMSQLDSCRFKSSIFYSIMTEQQKSELVIDVLKHRVDQVERTLAH